MHDRPSINIYRYAALLLLLVSSGQLLAADANGPTPASPFVQTQPAISIIIDDLGNLKSRDMRAIQLPGAITYAFLPHTPHVRSLAKYAHALHKEVMLHLPMEAMAHKHMGPGGLTLEMSHQELARQLAIDLESVPHAAGINNHMGSLLTQHPGHMAWLMQEISKHDNLYFVDSYTAKGSIARQVANEHWVPNLRRDVFLDDDRDPEKIKQQFARLLKKARSNGTALAIGHPYPETLAILEQQLPQLEAAGIVLVPVSKLLGLYSQRFDTWRAALSPAHAGATILK